MAAIKIHIYAGTNDGSVSCDFRAPNNIGHNEGDEHRTIFEIDPASDEQIAEVLEFGPKLNAILAKAVSPIVGEGGARIGVWDN